METIPREFGCLLGRRRTCNPSESFESVVLTPVCTNGKQELQIRRAKVRDDMTEFGRVPECWLCETRKGSDEEVERGRRDPGKEGPWRWRGEILPEPRSRNLTDVRFWSDQMASCGRHAVDAIVDRRLPWPPTRRICVLARTR